MDKHPDAIFVIDPCEDSMAISEARTRKIPIVAVCDTNCDPDLIDHPIPGNDDAARAIKLFCGFVADAIIEGRAEYEKAKAAKSVEGAEAEMRKAAGDAERAEGAPGAEVPSQETANEELLAKDTAEGDTDELKPGNPEEEAKKTAPTEPTERPEATAVVEKTDKPKAEAAG